MAMYLLDTNVVSELRKPRPHGAVVAWLQSVAGQSPVDNVRASRLTAQAFQRSGRFGSGIQVGEIQLVPQALFNALGVAVFNPFEPSAQSAV